MKTKFTLLLIIATSLMGTSANSTNYVNNGTSTSYVLYSGDSLHIASGTYTGLIINWQAGAKISVAAGANFKPNSFSYFTGKIYIYGTGTFSSLDGQTSSFHLQNSGVVTVSGNVSMNNSAQLTNNYGAKLTVNGSFTANSSTLLNNGTLTVKSDVYVGSSSSFTNNNLFTAEGKLEINSSTGVNGGMLYTKKQLTLSGATVTNSCRMIADGTMNFSSSTLTNNGLLWATTAASNSTITNSSTITSQINGKIKAANLNNSGILNGKGYLYFTGSTTTSGTVGTSGTTSDSLWIYDASRTSSSTIFDSQSGKVYNNAKYTRFTAPDTVFSFPSCSVQYASMMASLPVHFESFAVRAVEKSAMITWTAEQDPGTAFEVQRSYDATKFETIGLVQADINQKDFSYVDRNPATNVTTVYYRIRAIEPTGSTHLTDTRLVHFGSIEQLSVTVYPNPFTSSLNLVFTTDRSQQIQIKAVNLAGQVQYTKSLESTSGSNRVALPEANGWPRGVYVLQIIGDKGLLTSARVVKQ